MSSPADQAATTTLAPLRVRSAGHGAAGTLPRQRTHDAGDDFLRDLMAAHGRAVLAFATGITRDRLLAEDVTQETMIRAWHQRDRLDTSTNRIRSWLFRVAHNIAIDKFRARQSRAVALGEIRPDAAICDDPADDVVLATRVAGAMSRLSRDHAAVVRECYLNDRSAAQAAELLGIPVGTVKSRLYYALRALREALASA